MAIAKVASTIAVTGGTSITTSGIDTTGANLLVLLVTFQAGFGYPSVSDSKGNTWTGLSTPQQGNANHQIFYSTPTSVGTAHTFTATGSRFYTVIPIAFSGAKSSSPYEAETSATQLNGTALATGSLTPAEDGELLIAVASCSGTGWPAISINTGFALDGSDNGTVSNIGGALAYYVQPTAAAINPTWDYGGTLSGGGTAGLASFKAAAADYIPPRFERTRQAVTRGSRW